jgi:hypothetical protein
MRSELAAESLRKRPDIHALVTRHLEALFKRHMQEMCVCGHGRSMHGFRAGTGHCIAHIQATWARSLPCNCTNFIEYTPSTPVFARSPSDPFSDVDDERVERGE